MATTVAVVAEAMASGTGSGGGVASAVAVAVGRGGGLNRGGCGIQRLISDGVQVTSQGPCVRRVRRPTQEVTERGPAKGHRWIRYAAETLRCAVDW